ncbi:MAG TPA: Rrf2 family transcriptional regulator [Firmicutes bacterium]|nr:Rrf2 family transcriptional regulator [Bacillota bacterium]
MQISTRGRYGLRAMVDMALHTTEGPMALRVIAERQDISESYLEQVFTSLRKAGFVRASRGAQGGYELGRPANRMTVGEILRSLEGPIIPVHCVGDASANFYCERENYCTTRSFWEDLRDKINEFLDSVTLQDLTDKARTRVPEEPMYFI